MKPHARFSYSLIEPVKRHSRFVAFMLVMVGLCIFCAVLAGIKFSKSTLLISFSNVTIVKYLRGTSGFGGMLFTNIFTISIFSAIIIISCCKKYCVSVGIFFYCYYVYAQTLTLIAFMLEYGIINTLAISVCMLISMFIMIFLMLELFLLSIECEGNRFYIKSALSSCGHILVLMGLLLLVQGVVFFVLRNYVIVLVY